MIVKIILRQPLLFYSGLGIQIDGEACVLFLCAWGRVIVAGIPVQGVNTVHFLLGKGEVEEVPVFPDVAGIGGTGNHGSPLLDVPAQDNLGGGLTVLAVSYTHLTLPTILEV